MDIKAGVYSDQYNEAGCSDMQDMDLNSGKFFYLPVVTVIVADDLRACVPNN